MWVIRTGPRQTSTTTPTPTTPTTPPVGWGDHEEDFFGSYRPSQRTSLSSLNYPTLNLPRMQAPPAFDYEKFAAPTQAEAEQEPGFDYALKQGVKAYENSKAYTGTYRGGATIKGSTITPATWRTRITGRSLSARRRPTTATGTTPRRTT